MPRVSSVAAALAVLSCATATAGAASVTVAGLADSEDGFSYGVDALFSPTAAWSVGAGAGRQESSVGGASFSGTSLRGSTEFTFGAFSAGLSLQHWKDSNQLKSTTVRGQLGWMSANGLSLSALFDARSMEVQYTATVLGLPQDSRIDFDGFGVGADVSWFGAEWNLGARFIEYDYGRSVDRVRAVIEATSTQRFPRLESLLGTIVTRASGAPDRQLAATAGRQFSSSSLQGDWTMQRDALTGDRINSFALTHGYRFTEALRLDTTAGHSDNDAGDSAFFGGLALTWRKAP